MLKQLIQRWSDWVGDRHLELAIHAQLRKQGYAVHAARIRDAHLAAIERPGWVMVHRFRVETLDAEKNPVTLAGVARDDSRSEKILVALSPHAGEIQRQFSAWSEGLIRKG